MTAIKDRMVKSNESVTKLRGEGYSSIRLDDIQRFKTFHAKKK